MEPGHPPRTCANSVNALQPSETMLRGRPQRNESMVEFLVLTASLYPSLTLETGDPGCLSDLNDQCLPLLAV